jgi:hypothetical protein
VHRTAIEQAINQGAVAPTDINMKDGARTTMMFCLPFLKSAMVWSRSA